MELLADSGGFSPGVTLDAASIGDDAVYRLSTPTWRSSSPVRRD